MNLPEIEAIIAAQPYAAGTVDRALLDAQILLTRDAQPDLYGRAPASPQYEVGSRPALESIIDTVLSGRREPAARLAALTRWCSRIPRDQPSPAHSTAAGYYGDFSGFLWGGDEEAVVAKGSPWPQEIARVLVTLSQMAGIAARLVFLYRAEPPDLHTVVEAWLQGSWAVFDPCANRFYLWPHHGYASAYALRQDPRLVDQCPEHGRIPFVDSAFYRTVAIAEYPLAGRNQYDYRRQPALGDDGPRLQRAAEVFS